MPPRATKPARTPSPATKKSSAKKPALASAYVFEMSAESGSAIWAETYATSDLDDLEQVVRRFCKQRGTPMFLLGEGGSASIYTVQASQVVSVIELRRYLRLRVGNRPPVKLSDTRSLAILGHALVAGEDDELDEIDEDSIHDLWADVDEDLYDRMRLAVLWKTLSKKLVPLNAPLLASGGQTTITTTLTKRKRGMLLHNGVTLHEGAWDWGANKPL